MTHERSEISVSLHDFVGVDANKSCDYTADICQKYFAELFAKRVANGQIVVLRDIFGNGATE